MFPPFDAKNPLPAQIRRHAPDGGGEHDRAAENRRRARVLAKGKKHPYRSEHNVEQADEARLRGRDELGALHENHEGEADRRQAEREEDQEIIGSDRLMRRIGEAEHAGAERAERVDGDHRHLRLAPLQDDHAGEGQGHQHRQRLPQQTPRAEAARDHDDDAGERDARGGERARRDALAIDEETDPRRDEGQGRVDHHDVGDRRRHDRGGVGGDRDHRQ